MNRGRPPVDLSKLNVAIELIRLGSTVGQAALKAGINRNTLLRYGISKKSVTESKVAFAIPLSPEIRESIAGRVYEIERDIAGSFRSVIARANVSLIMSTEAAQLETDTLLAAIKAERLRNEARRYD